MENESVKKRMMFITAEDYNFLSYNIFIILNGLDCVVGKSSFKDHRKLSFLIDFVSNGKLIDIIEKQYYSPNTKLNEIDKGILKQSFTDSLLRIRTINQLVYTLSNEQIIQITDKRLDKLSIMLDKNLVQKEFFKGELFTIERTNIKRLKLIVKRLSVLDISTMLTNLYYNHGVANEQLIN